MYDITNLMLSITNFMLQMRLAKVTNKLSFVSSVTSGRQVQGDEPDFMREIEEMKEEISSLKVVVLTFPDHVTQVIERQLNNIKSELTNRIEKVAPSNRSTHMDESNMKDTAPDNVEFVDIPSASCKKKKVIDDCELLGEKAEELVPNLEATINEISELCGKKSHVLVKHGEMSSRKRKKVDDLSDVSSYERFSKSGGHIVGPFRLRDGVRVEVFKLTQFLFNQTYQEGKFLFLKKKKKIICVFSFYKKL